MLTIATHTAPTFALAPMVQVTDGELQRFADLIYSRAGIRVSPQKKTLLSNRLRRRLRQTGVQSFADYYRHLQRLRDDDPEWDAFLQEITSHETYLFRDEAQWDWFQRVFLINRAAAARNDAAQRTLRIWSAACSTGDEPITAACCIAACLPEFPQWKIHILGTDLGTGALMQAKSAVFGERAMRLVPESYRRRFFTKAADAHTWHARPMLTDMIAYRQHNLIEPLAERPFDLVFLKNVLIYFDKSSKAAVVRHVCAAVRPGGLLATGAAEGVGDLLPDFTRLETWLHRKPTH